MKYKKIEIEEQGIVKSQSIGLFKEVSIVYGYNNCGKTTLLKTINTQLDKQFQKSILDDISTELSLYLPTNRLIVSERYTNEYNVHDREQLLNYKKDIYQDFALHLNVLRENLLKNTFICEYIMRAVNEMFSTHIQDYSQRYSDGIENVINIYINIIWILTWDVDYQCSSSEKLHQMIKERCAYIFIDEIEMFLHVKIQDQFIARIRQDFPNCIFVFTTHSPLLLTRYKDIDIYELRDGSLKNIESDCYFNDLDNIYESFFEVKELPDDVEERIDYLVDVIMGNVKPNKSKILEFSNYIEQNYPNIAKKYNRHLVKAEMKAEVNK